MFISIALCTYNGETFLGNQLESICNQTTMPNEIVVCDDGSTDGTLQVLEQFKEKFPHVFKIFKNDKNLGYTKNFEKAISLCSGDLIFLSDQDDIWKDNKIEILKSIAENNPSKSVFAHRIEILNTNREVQNISFWDIDDFNKNWNNDELLQYLLFQRNVFPGMSLAITKEAKEKYLPLQTPHKNIIHDYEIILKSCKNNSFLLVDFPLSLYRMHSNQNIGFDTDINKKTAETLASFYSKIKRISLINNCIAAFKLDLKLSDLYKEKCREDYRKFILNLPIPKRWITQIKMKYYYKILDEIS
jgi:glycosyltransferase involved in cell wall biosynthesis